MTQLHQCRCAICGEVGVITPALPKVFADMAEHNFKVMYGEPLAEATAAPIATCPHGYTVCAVCKFPAT